MVVTVLNETVPIPLPNSPRIMNWSKRRRSPHNSVSVNTHTDRGFAMVVTQQGRAQ